MLVQRGAGLSSGLRIGTISIDPSDYSDWCERRFIFWPADRVVSIATLLSVETQLHERVPPTEYGAIHHDYQPASCLAAPQNGSSYDDCWNEFRPLF